jgi:hypothetical protein
VAQEIPHISWNPTIHWCSFKTLLLVHILDQVESFLHSHIIFSDNYRRSLPFRLSHVINTRPHRIASTLLIGQCVSHVLVDIGI